MYKCQTAKQRMDDSPVQQSAQSHPKGPTDILGCNDNPGVSVNSPSAGFTDATIMTARCRIIGLCPLDRCGNYTKWTDYT